LRKFPQDSSVLSLRPLGVIFILAQRRLYPLPAFSNYTVAARSPARQAQCAGVWPIFGPRDFFQRMWAAGFHAYQITSGLFHVWRAWGFTNEFQVLCTAIGALVMAGLHAQLPVSSHYHSSPKLEFGSRTVESNAQPPSGRSSGLGSSPGLGHLLHVVPAHHPVDGLPSDAVPLSLNGKVIASVADIPLCP